MAEANVDRVRSVLACINAGDLDGAMADIGDDVSYEAPYYKLHVHGRDRLREMFANVGTRFTEIDYQLTRHFATVDDDLVIVEAKGNHAVAGSDKRYCNDYVLFVWFSGGKVVRWVEYSDPAVFAEATS